MRFILLLLTLFLSGIFQAQTISYSQLTQLHTNTDASVVNAIWQDSSGLIWMGTNSGLLSFDGYTFQTHYMYGQESNVRIYDEVQDGHFSIWLLTTAFYAMITKRTVMPHFPSGFPTIPVACCLPEGPCG